VYNVLRNRNIFQEWIFVPKKKHLKLRPTSISVRTECNAVYRLTHCCAIDPAYWLFVCGLKTRSRYVG
jgi:hypothetical protein